MAMKLPGVEALGAAPSGRSGKPIASYDTTAIGRGAAQLGAGIASMGADLNRVAATKQATVDKATAFETQRRYLEFTAAQEKALQDTGQQTHPGAFGFTESYRESYKKAAKEFFSSVPDELKPQYDVKLFEAEDSLAGRANTFERDQRAGYYTTKVSEGLKVVEDKLYRNPKAFDENLAEGNAFIDSIPDGDVSPIAKDALRREWKKKAQLAALNGMPPVARVEALGGEVSGRPAVNAVVDRIIGVESGGNASAKNPRSSASGLGQFTDSTWVATVRKHRPDIGGSNDDIIALKTDPSLGREMTIRHTEDNANALAASGHAITAGNLYLAHFAGIGGAKKVLGADPAASVESVLGRDVVAANPFLAGKDVAWLRDWTAKKMGSGTVSPQFADMTYGERETIIASSAKDVADLAAADAARQKAAYDLHDKALGLDIELGKVVSEAQIINDQSLDDGDVLKHLKAFRARQKEDGDVRDLVAAIVGGDSKGAAVNGFDTDERKVGDKAYESMMKAAPEQADVVTEAFVRSTGYVPKSVQAEIRQGAASTDPATLAATLSRADALELAAPISFGAFDGGADARDKLTLYRHYVNDLGIAGDEAAQRIIAMNDPANKVNRDVLKPQVKEFLEGLSIGEVTDSFDPSGWPGDEPGAGVMPVQANGLLAEYKEIAEQKFYESGGDAGAAKARALADIKRRWNVSNISGSPNLMRLPPENHYPLVDGGHAYLRDDAMKTAEDYVKEAFLERKVENVAILATDITRADIEMKRPPRYRLFYQYTEDGQTLFDEVVSGPWGLDAKTVEGHAMTDRQRAKKAFMEERERNDAVNDVVRASRSEADAIIADPSQPDWLKSMRAQSALTLGEMNAADKRERQLPGSKEFPRRAIDKAIVDLTFPFKAPPGAPILGPQ